MSEIFNELEHSVARLQTLVQICNNRIEELETRINELQSELEQSEKRFALHLRQHRGGSV